MFPSDGPMSSLGRLLPVVPLSWAIITTVSRQLDTRDFGPEHVCILGRSCWQQWEKIQDRKRCLVGTAAGGGARVQVSGAAGRTGAVALRVKISERTGVCRGHANGTIAPASQSQSEVNFTENAGFSS